MTATLTHQRPLRIAADHPALPGHFPGHPLVPGVVLLDLVLASAQDWLARPLSATALTQAKFIAPLHPGQPAQLSLALTDTRLKFEIRSDAQTIAQGAFELTGPAA